MLKDASYMKRMGELLVFHQIISRPEELRDENFDDMILAFQEKSNMMADGLPRWETLWNMQYPWVQQLPKMKFTRCEVDKIPGIESLDHVMLREDAAERFNALRKEVLSLGGTMPIMEGKRPLSEKVSVSKSIISLHYTGLAFDLAGTAGFFNPDKDPFVVTLGGNGYWEIWCRSASAGDMKMNAMYWESLESGVDKTKTVMGKFFSFTRVCEKHGFYPLRPRMSFTRSTIRKYTGSEWWHFQANDLLIPNLSLFGIELMRIEGYTPEYIRQTNEAAWERKKSLFQVEWF